MAHAQKPDFVFRRNGRVHLNRWGLQFCRLLAAEVCASAVVMLDTPCSEGAWEYWLPTPFVSFSLTSPPVRHHVPSGFNWILPPGLTFKNSACWLHCIYVFCVALRRNSNFCLIHNEHTGFYNQNGECLLRGTTWVLT